MLLRCTQLDIIHLCTYVWQQYVLNDGLIKHYSFGGKFSLLHFTMNILVPKADHFQYKKSQVQVKYLISRQCCDSENSSLNMRVNGSLAMVKTTDLIRKKYTIVYKHNFRYFSSAIPVAQLVRALDCVRDAQTARDRASAVHFFTFLLISLFFSSFFSHLLSQCYLDRK